MYEFLEEGISTLFSEDTDKTGEPDGGTMGDQFRLAESDKAIADKKAGAKGVSEFMAMADKISSSAAKGAAGGAKINSIAEIGLGSYDSTTYEV